MLLSSLSTDFNFRIQSKLNLGGFGKSTAEFISAWIFKNNIKNLDDLRSTNLQKIFSDYLNLYVETESMKPSGADLVCMLLGKVAYFKKSVVESEALNWSFKNLDFAIISTGLKVNTHEHLNNLNKTVIEDLPLKSQIVVNSYLDNNEQLFINSLSEWSNLLYSKKLQNEDVWIQKGSIEKNKKILLAKPNGALGADTMTILFERLNKEAVIDDLKSANYTICATSENLSEGVNYVV